MKKLLSIILSVAMVTTILGNVAFAEGISSESINISNKKDDIIRGYQEAILDLKLNSSGMAIANTNNSSSISQIQENTVSALNEAGYEAYDVNPQSFENVEATLDTDLEGSGLNPEYSYIVLIEGEENNSTISPQSAASSSFYHTYNGTTYTLRWMTVYASDDPIMSKSSDVDVLSSKVAKTIQNCLDTVIIACISKVNASLGTVASISGLSVADFAPAQTVTMRLNGGTNWTRRYTQVWSNFHSAWLNGCCVEEVAALSHMSGSYYSANSNRYELVPQNIKRVTRYSSKFYNDQWRRDYAVIGYLNSSTQWNSVGDVEYKYGNETKITHRHNF